jgi:hypothetical protein
MFHFTIRDMLWLTVVVALGLGWSIHSSRLNARIQSLETIVGVELREVFPLDWEGQLAAIRNEKAILQYRIKALKFELETRGHLVEMGESSVSVDRPPVP